MKNRFRRTRLRPPPHFLSVLQDWQYWTRPSRRPRCSARDSEMSPRRRTSGTRSPSWSSHSVARSRTGRGRRKASTATTTGSPLRPRPLRRRVRRRRLCRPIARPRICGKDAHSSSDNPASTFNARNAMQWFRRRSGVKPDRPGPVYHGQRQHQHDSLKGFPKRWGDTLQKSSCSWRLRIGKGRAQTKLAVTHRYHPHGVMLAAVVRLVHM